MQHLAMKRLALGLVLMLGSVSLTVAATLPSDKAPQGVERPLPAAYPWINFR